MKKQITLDLHGVKHADVEDKLIDFFFWQGFDHKGVNIITGNSSKNARISYEFP
jgi:hypothetical protein